MAVNSNTNNSYPEIKYFCPVTGLEIYTRPEWQSQKISADYTVDYWIIGDSILYTKPVGNVDLKGIKASLKIDDAIAAEIAGGTGRYIQLEDYSQLHNVTIEARKYFVDYFNNNDRVAALFLCNLSQILNLAIKIGKRFAFPGVNVLTGGQYHQAIEKALDICDVENLPKGTFVFGQPFRYREKNESLVPVELATNPEWGFKTPDYCNQSFIIDKKILFSIPEGQLKAEHIPRINKIHNSVKKHAKFDYIVVDASKISGFTRKSRHLFIKYVLNWHRDIPFRMYILYGANPLVSAAVKMSRPFMPFTIGAAGDITQAIEMIRKDQRDRHQPASNGERLEKDLIQRYVDDLLLFIGSINWEKEGINTDIGEIDEKHPFSSVFNSIKLIKEELDDLTARRRENELKLRENEEKYSNLFLYSNDGIFIHDMDGRILDVNNKALDLFEYSKKKMLTFNVRDLHPHEPPEKSDAAFQSLATDGFVNFEIQFQKKNGERFPAEISASVFEINGQKVVQGLVRDITRRKEAEAVLRNYQTLVETMNDGVVIIDQQLKITYVNNAICRMSGYTAEEIIGQPAIKFLDDHNQLQLEAEIANWPQSDTHVFEIEWVGKDNRLISSIISPNPIFNENGEFTGFMGIVTNTTDLNKARMEKDQIQAQLYHSQKMEAIGTLAGGVAHDFNNYLTTILGCADLMMLKRGDPGKQTKYIGEIRNAAERSAALTRQLLAFSRRQILEKTTVNLNHVVSNMEKMLQRLIGENIELQTKLATDLSQINADPAQMEQIILNLAVNARDAMPEGGSLRIITENANIDEYYSRQFTYARPGEFICMTFEDNGCGMEPEVVENIFEPFFTTKISSQGTGLGLSVVYGVVKQHNGWINVYSEPSHGTRFKIYLPVEKALAQKTGKESSKGPKTIQNKYQGKGERILLVEDQDEVREMIISALQIHGYHVEPAVSYGEADALITSENEAFDLLFSDVILPDGNGIDLAKKITAENPNIKVLLSSGYTEEKARIDIIEENRFHFLQKPYPLEKMLEKVSKALAG